MKSLTIAATRSTPYISFDIKTHIFRISGCSVPEDALAFYRPVIQWLHEYSLYPCSQVVCIVSLSYFSTASSKMLFEVFKVLAEMKLKGWRVNVHWLHEKEDSDIREAGEIYSEFFDLNFEIVPN